LLTGLRFGRGFPEHTGVVRHVALKQQLLQVRSGKFGKEFGQALVKSQPMHARKNRDSAKLRLKLLFGGSA
jgi:hypothetical protein